MNEPDTDSTLPTVAGGPEADRKLTWSERGSRRLNRLRATVAKALLVSGEEGSPIPDAVAFLHRVVRGAEPATIETKGVAAAALLRAGVSLTAGGQPAGSTVDARSVHVHVEALPAESLGLASRLLASLGGSEPRGPHVEFDPGQVRPDPAPHPLPVGKTRAGRNGKAGKA